MPLKPAENVDAWCLTEVQGLDPVTFFLQDFGGGKGRAVIECYGQAWVLIFGAMGKETLREFLVTCNTDYLANRMWPPRQPRDKADYAYLCRIVAAVQDAIKEQSRTAPEHISPAARIVELEELLIPLMDLGQYRLNGGSYCMHVMDGRFCGRGEAWAGHVKEGFSSLSAVDHPFVSGAPKVEL